MRIGGIIIIGIIIAAVFAAGCTEKLPILSFNETNETNTTTSNTSTLNETDLNLTNITLNTSPIFHDPGIPGDPEEPEP